jgi:hypothetical protein
VESAPAVSPPGGSLAAERPGGCKGGKNMEHPAEKIKKIILEASEEECVCILEAILEVMIKNPLD